jgi:2-C-methyl-D-erythritol 4-phosphate cytidylyltransferase
MKQVRTFGVVIPAAGTGTRFGGGDKLLVDLNGRSVLQRSVGLFAGREDVTQIVVVTGGERVEVYRAHLAGVLLPREAVKVAFVVGGQQRWQSVLNGLRHLAEGAAGREVPACVAIHDAARPLCPPEVIGEAFAAAAAYGAGLPCVLEPATLKRRGADGNVAETVDRSGLYQAQTPQCFELAKLLAGYEELVKAGRVADLTDDAQVYERMGRPVRMTTGAAVNLKITTVADVAVARAVLAAGAR